MITTLLDMLGWNRDFQTVSELINNIVGLVVLIGFIGSFFYLIFSLFGGMKKM